MIYQDGERVIVHSLGDNKEYIGIICGILGGQDSIATYYLVEITIDDEYKYSVRSISEHCISPLSASTMTTKSLAII